MAKHRIGGLIPIRLASERLPGKALLKICGRPVCWHLLDRICATGYVAREDVVVCTTEEAQDDPLDETVREYGCSVFRGSTDDIIKRFNDAIEHFRFDAVIQIDGDDPLSATEYMIKTMDTLLADTTLDIVTCEGLPLGIATKSFTRSAMQKVFRHYKTERNDTGFINFFTKTGLCRQAVVKPLSPDHVLDEARLTLDYEVDLEVFRRIFEALYQPGMPPFGLTEVVRFLRAHPEVARANLSVEEQYWQRWNRDKSQLEYTDTDGAIRRL